MIHSDVPESFSPRLVPLLPQSLLGNQEFPHLGCLAGDYPHKDIAMNDRGSQGNASVGAIAQVDDLEAVEFG